MFKNFYSSLLSLHVLNRLVYDVRGSNYKIELLQDINPNGSSGPSRFERLEPADGSNNKMFFVADDGTHSVEPWVSDGTRAGTKLLKDIHPGDLTSGRGSNKNAHGKIYFVADDGITGDELWLSDGTSAGTKRVKDIFPGSTGSDPRYMSEFGIDLYFFAQSSDTNRRQLWKTDGTDANTVEISKVQGGFNPRSSLNKVGNILIFLSRDENNWNSIWKVDGDVASQITPQELEVLQQSGFGRSLTAEVLGKVYFSAASANGVALYSTDGSVVNKVKDDIKLFLVSRSMIDDQRVLFVAEQQDFSVWVTDGTSQGTKLLLDNLVRVYFFPTYDGKTLFMAEDSTPGLKMYSSDGTVAGTKVIFKFDSTKEVTPKAGSKMGEDGPFFWGMTVGSLYEIWLIEGSDKEPKKLREFLTHPDDNSYDMNYLNNATILFGSYDNNTGVELWEISKISSSSTVFSFSMGAIFSITALFSLIFI